MKIPLLVLAFLCLAAAAGAADAPPAKKKWTKSSGQSPSAQPGARVERKKTGFERPGEGLTRTGDGAVSGGGGGGSAASSSKSFAKTKVAVSASPSGPWAVNGEVCRTGSVYSRTTGVDRGKPPKGCASPFDSKDCLDVAKHRDFLPNEWVDPFTIQTVVNGPDYPAGKYAMYLSDSKNSVKQVGFATLKDCAPPAKTCRWTSPDAVIGPCSGPGCGSPPCSTANQGAQGMGGGGMWTCTCN